jgi:CBS domain-containing protein
MTIARIMEGRSGETITANSGESVRTVVARLAEHRIGAVPVMDGDAVIGVFSERDLVYCIAVKGNAAFDLPVDEAMTAPAVCATSDTGVLAALSLMTKRRIRHLPIVEGGVLRGFVSIGDLVKYRIDKIEAEAEGMRQYIQAV